MKMTGPLVVVGDALLDIDLVGTARRLSPDAPAPVIEDVQEQARPGGAGLAALLAAGDRREVVLVTPLADDSAAERLRALLAGELTVLALPYEGGDTPVKTRVIADGQSVTRVDRGSRVGRIRGVPDVVQDTLRSARAVLVADYGRGSTAEPPLRAVLRAAASRVPLVWDPHPRGAVPVPGARLVTPNLAELGQFAADVAVRGPAECFAAVGTRAAELCNRWRCQAVVVTLGRRGALLSFGAGTPLVVPAERVSAVDTCGAGDRFAATATGLLADGALPSEAVAGAVRASSRFVAAGGAGAMRAGAARRDADGSAGRGGTGGDSAFDVIARTRAVGGTVVATGGCFDLLHAGHVATLEAARRLGDCLVVCLNSDASVRRLKGPARPIVAAADRARVLAALEYVDAVAVFDEDTPAALLDRLRPDLWVKGGDYIDAALPEAELIARWGGQAVILPYLDGRSTTALVRAANGRGGSKSSSEHSEPAKGAHT
jgi:rfaE bifunctional protein nucleotidyltransferase chain/domain/rfaE bifunctional protein kinase chain/domain